MSQATAAVVGAVVGGLIAAASAWWGVKTTRRAALQDRQYDARRDAYVAFLEKSHASAHALGNLATQMGVDLPTGEDRLAITYSIDAEVSPQLRVVEIVGPKSVSDAAHDVQKRLYQFRKALTDAIDSGDPIPYSPADGRYEAAYKPYRSARSGFVKAAKEELERLEANAG